MNSGKQKLLENVWIRLVLVLSLIALFFFICYFLKGILISLFLAFTIAYVFDPVVDFIETRKMIFHKIRIRRTYAICILLLGVTLCTGGLLTYVVPKTVNGMHQVGDMFKKKIPTVCSSVENMLERYGNKDVALFFSEKLTFFIDKIGLNTNLKDGEVDKTLLNQDNDEGKNTLPKKYNVAREEVSINFNENGNSAGAYPSNEKGGNVGTYSSKTFKYASNIIKNIFKSTFGFLSIVINFFIFGVVTIYLLKDFDHITAKIEDLIPEYRRDKLSVIFSKIDVDLKEFFRGQLIVCLILSFIYSIGLTIVGVPLAFILGFVAGVGNVIPYFGTFVGLGLTMIITFFQFQDIQHLAFVAIVFGFGQLLEGTFITPKIIGDKLGLNPVVVIVSILIWSQLLGFLGLLLAVPITAAAKVLIDEGVVKYKKSSFYKK